jgi:hypothetical protein
VTIERLAYRPLRNAPRLNAAPQVLGELVLDVPGQSSPFGIFISRAV